MLKKLFYIGLGISIIVVKKSVSYLLDKKEQAGEQSSSMMDGESGLPEAIEQPDAQLVTEEIVSRAKESVSVAAADDLTEINGIGPTYAKRLKEAGITTYSALSKKSPEELRSVTKATGKSADAESWIIQAASLA